MEFALSEDQQMFQASIKGYLETHAPLETIREIAAGKDAPVDEITAGLGELGVTQMLIPEAYGGLGLGLLDVALMQEAIGQAVAPDIILPNAMATVALLASGSAGQKENWLVRLASGEVRFGVAFNDHVGVREGSGIAYEGDALTGTSLFVLGARKATHLMIADRAGGLHIVNARADTVHVNDLKTIDKTRDYSEVVCKSAPAETLAGEAAEGQGIARALLAGCLLVASDTLGACEVMLERAVAYAMERKQFGRVIGSFQSIKHLCAEMAGEIEPARALIWHAAHGFDEGFEDGELMILLAKSHMAEIGTKIARTATEVHGGMGFTDLLGLHYWFKRVGANRQLFGGPEHLRAKAARLQRW